MEIRRMHDYAYFKWIHDEYIPFDQATHDKNAEFCKKHLKNYILLSLIFSTQ